MAWSEFDSEDWGVDMLAHPLLNIIYYSSAEVGPGGRGAGPGPGPGGVHVGQRTVAAGQGGCTTAVAYSGGGPGGE